jgi:hypothetical protein
VSVREGSPGLPHSSWETMVAESVLDEGMLPVRVHKQWVYSQMLSNLAEGQAWLELQILLGSD